MMQICFMIENGYTVHFVKKYMFEYYCVLFGE